MGVHLRCEDGVLIVQASGVLTLDGMRELRSAIARAAQDARAVVMDFRSAVWLLDGRAMAKFGAEAAVGSHKVDRPVAMIVSPMHRDSTARYCASASLNGLVRVAFTDAPSAYSWASRRAPRRGRACCAVCAPVAAAGSK